MQTRDVSCYLPEMRRAVIALAVVLAMIVAGYINGGIGGGYVDRLLGYQQPNNGVEPFKPVPFPSGQSQPSRRQRTLQPRDDMCVRPAVGYPPSPCSPSIGHGSLGGY